MSDDMIVFDPPHLGPAPPHLDKPLGSFLQARIAAGASGQPGSQFAVAPRDDKHLYDSLTAALAPYVSQSGLAIARTTVRGVPLTLSVNPTLSSVTIMLEGKFG